MFAIAGVQVGNQHTLHACISQCISALCIECIINSDAGGADRFCSRHRR